MPELVNFGFSLAQRVMPYLTEVRGSKAAFKLSSVLGFVKECASSSVGKNSKEGTESWEAVAAFFGKVVEELNKLITVATEQENVFKSKLREFFIVRTLLMSAQLPVLRHGSSALTRLSPLPLSTSRQSARLRNSTTRCKRLCALSKQRISIYKKRA